MAKTRSTRILKTLLAILATSISIHAAVEMPPLPDAPINPPAPTMISVQRSQVHAEITFSYQGAIPEAFQIMRRYNGATESATIKGAATLKHTVVVATGVYTYTFTDKKLDRDRVYSYAVIAFTEDGTSPESQSLMVQPVDKH